ncbi:MAG: aminopeptidase [Rhodocyclales bacterium CG17_big_fil_post_rev_8_21_14_2_50_68_7]|nr:MAG: aminopeptidase [Rhodocyclales bacterium CG17_big_fil_post_rev_8_21_14_2_50_68_7]PJA57498.1 MAG: aminopeptidase [Rhodocyclales bacterium CG_4_9_14_3_um_filter_68_10]
MRLLLALLAATALGSALLLPGCAAPGYYLQAASGQFEVWRRSRPIAQVRSDAGTAPALRERLALAERIRAFASRSLALPDNGSYRKYADVRRPYVVWNVFAAREFSVRPEQWCFPVAGCVSYRGYFAHPDALAFAAALRSRGHEIHVAGVTAYSTLGWFDDPVLNTFIHYPESELARLIFHELAHQVAWADGDTEFNEAFAVAVELEGIARWLAASGSADERETFATAQRRRSRFAALVLGARERLDRLYGSGASEHAMRKAKAEILSGLKRDYAALREGDWRGFAGYDRWFGADINNATLASIGIYTRWVPAFRALIARSGGDLPTFYARVRELAADAPETRHAALEAALRDAAREGGG